MRRTTRLLVLSFSSLLLVACGGDDGGASNADGGAADAAQPDAPVPDAMVPCADIAETPMTLAETGLYCDPATETIGTGVRPFTPQYQLWSDGATKRRWVYLPPGTQIDTSNMDFWDFPQGTKLWKEFTVDGKRVETRMLEHYGALSVEWNYVAFAWNMDGTEATRVDPSGSMNVLGTNHDIPGVAACNNCHGKTGTKPLGFSAILLDHTVTDGSVNLATLAEEGLLTNNPTGFTTGAQGPFYPIPGNSTDQATLGYLHANCGGCHNPNALTVPDMVLRLTADTAIDTVAKTETYTSTVNIQSSTGIDRIEPGSPSTSRIHVRLGDFTPPQMPPVGVETNDTTGLAAIDAWICSLMASQECTDLGF